MSQPFDASKSLATLEQDNTVIAVIEMSQLQSKWLVAAVVPGVKRQPLKKHGIRRRGGTIFTAALPSDEPQVQAEVRTHLIISGTRFSVPIECRMRVHNIRRM